MCRCFLVNDGQKVEIVNGYVVQPEYGVCGCQSAQSLAVFVYPVPAVIPFGRCRDRATCRLFTHWDLPVQCFSFAAAVTGQFGVILPRLQVIDQFFFCSSRSAASIIARDSGLLHNAERNSVILSEMYLMFSGVQGY